MAKKKIQYKIYIDRDFKTVSTRDKETGRLTGRKNVGGFGDRTAIRRVSSPGKYKGQLLGRTHPIQVKGDSRKRGTLRRRL